jgi:hypothetical protein
MGPVGVKKTIHIRALTLHTLFGPEEGAKLCVRKFGNTVHIDATYRYMSRINMKGIRVFGNRVLRGVFAPKGEVQEDGENYVISSFVIFSLPNVITANKT